jgi:hypothetical protein
MCSRFSDSDCPTIFEIVALSEAFLAATRSAVRALLPTQLRKTLDEGTAVKRFVIAIAAMLVAGTASASVPLFAAKCPTGITVDSSAQGQVYINGKVAKLIQRPGSQCASATSAWHATVAHGHGRYHPPGWPNARHLLREGPSG